MNDDKWQQHVRSRIEDLVATAKASNHKWGAWELEFIESLGEKLEHQEIKMSPKQYAKMEDLWDKI